MDVDVACDGLVELRNGRSEDGVGVRVSEEEEGKDSRVSEVEEEEEDKSRKREGDAVSGKKALVQQYNNMMSEFDEFVANEKNSAVGSSGGSLNSSRMSYTFEMGDMVWGKVKSHPWWPGHIFNEAFATSSVRRSRREGYVLVAFFGDSSYGWFDPAELIPFDVYFAEKSRQTFSKNFIKAVEEAVDEASRRMGLGLICRCRNAFNFRPTNVQGYFEVDVPDYEPRGVYSLGQIKTARAEFKPVRTLSFIKQLALAPLSSDQKSLDFVKHKATAVAYRRAIFEEFDETYAQAFGVQNARAARDSADVGQTVKEPYRAPLSGPLVYAEALGGSRSSTKPMKVKDHSKKDKYLLKRRDDLNMRQNTPEAAGSSAPAAYIEGSSEVAAGGYVLQKRTPMASTSPQLSAKLELGQSADATFGQDKPGKAVEQTAAHTNATGGSSAAELKLSSDKIDANEQMRTKHDSPTASVSEESDMLGKMSDSKVPKPQEGSGKPEQNLQKKLQESQMLDQIQDGGMGACPSVDDTKSAVGASADDPMKKMKMKKKKLLKEPMIQPGSENAVMGEKKMKKRKELGLEPSSDQQQKRLAIGKVGAVLGKIAGKLARGDMGPREGLQPDKQKKADGGNLPADSTVKVPIFGTGITDTQAQLCQLLFGLQSLALDPFHANERSSPAVVRQSFLRFRSLVYQKSLSLAQPAEPDSTESRPARPASSVSTEQSPGEAVRNLSSSKPIKTPARSEDPTKSGRKRIPSDRQGEMEAKRVKKINELKLLAAEKKGAHKVQDTQRGEGKESVAAAPQRVVKPALPKKMEPPSKVVQPTMLVMKFPQGTTLPSVAELKARFARFGPLDSSSIRVFWKSFTCRVVFQHKQDAQAAHKYAIANTSLFGNVSVRYILRDVEVPGTEVPEPARSRVDDPIHETQQVKESPADRSVPAIAYQPSQQSALQLKSCLKKPQGDDAGQLASSNTGRGTARVKFMLGEEENSRQDQSVVGNGNNFNNNASFADGGASSSSSSTVGMIFNSKNFQKVVPPTTTTAPILPLPYQYSKPQLNNTQHSELATQTIHTVKTANITPDVPAVDISQQMISLLTRCNDVVRNLTGLLGYVPYHPL